MVLCAGLGTRLRPLTDELPKPLVPVGDRSLLRHIFDHLAATGFERVVVNTHHLSTTFASAVAELPLPCEVVHEPDIRGTAGGVAGALAHLGDDAVLVWNGDILTRPPTDALLARARATGQLCLAVAPRPRGTGTVGLDAAGRVVRLRGEVFATELHGADYVGVAALGRDCLRSLPARGCLFGDWALPRLREGGPIETVFTTERWIDVGGLLSYWEANLAWLASQRGDGAYVGKGSVVARDVKLEHSLVLRGANVEGSGAFRRCIVWPGGTAAAPLADCIVTTSGRIVRIPASHVPAYAATTG
jgi:mannose-1-phosphate guanylyltransferase